MWQGKLRINTVTDMNATVAFGWGGVSVITASSVHTTTSSADFGVVCTIFMLGGASWR